MAKLLIGQKGEKVLRGSYGRFVSKEKAKAVEIKDKIFIVSGKAEADKIQKEFGEGIVRNVEKSDLELKSSKLRDIR